MTKAINWPASFLNDVINENTVDTKIALRLGSIYYDHCYYVPDEIVDIRVDHKIIRPGVIVGEMKLCKINELLQEDLIKQKPSLQTIDNIVKYLSQTYNQEVTPDTQVTIVYYHNLNTDQSLNKVDDPHMS